MLRPVDLGLPSDDLSGYRLLYNPASGVIAVHVWVTRDNLDWGRVYIRRKDEQRYYVAGDPPDNCSDVSLITCDRPFLFFLRKKGERRDCWIHVGQKSERREDWGFNSEGVVRLDLTTGMSELLTIPGSVPGKQWIDDLQYASPDGDVLYGVVATSAGTGPVRRAIARIVWSHRRVDELAELMTAFV